MKQVNGTNAATSYNITSMIDPPKSKSDGISATVGCWFAAMFIATFILTAVNTVLLSLIMGRN